MRFSIQDKKKCAAFISIFGNLKFLTDNVLVKVDAERMYIQGMDSAHICIYELILTREWFATWSVSAPSEFGLFLPNFNKILSVWTDKQTILIHDEQEDKLDIEFTSDEKGVFDKFFQMPLMDLDYELLGIPEIEYDVDILMESVKFKQILEDLASFNDTVQFCGENESVVITSSSEGTMKVHITVDDVESLAITEGVVVTSTFSIRFLVHMCRFHKISTNCSIHISQDIPIKMLYDIDESSGSYMVFFLAPTIKED